MYDIIIIKAHLILPSFSPEKLYPEGKYSSIPNCTSFIKAFFTGASMTNRWGKGFVRRLTPEPLRFLRKTGNTFLLPVEI